MDSEEDILLQNDDSQICQYQKMSGNDKNHIPK